MLVTPDGLDHVLDELAEHEARQRRAFARAPTDRGSPVVTSPEPPPTVFVDPELLREYETLVAGKRQPLHLARGTTPPPVPGVDAGEPSVELEPGEAVAVD